MIKKIRKYLDDPNMDLQSRSFILLSIIALLGLLIALVSGLIIGQATVANVSLFIEFALFSGIMFWAVGFNQLKAAMIIIAAFLTFVFLPVAFFTSGGAAGGTPVWFAFSNFYIVMILTGKPKKFFLAAESVVVVICWIVGYYNPGYITEFDRKDAYIDSIATLFIVGIIMSLLISYQAFLFRQENERVNSQKKEIEDLNRSQSRFFSSMSHEIRTPINSILGLNEVILRQEDASDEIIRDAKNIQGAGKMLLTIINDILDLSKLDAGGMDIVPVDYRIDDMIEEIYNMVWLRANDKGLTLKAQIDPGIPSLLVGDEVRIKQIIINLLNNAVKYTYKGSVGLKIDYEQPYDNKIRLLISVTDTGMGIKREVIPQLFEVFKRVDQEKNRNIEGTGLGLSIVKQLVDLMDGEIKVDSEYGKGSTFSVSLLQDISDPAPIGEITLNEQKVLRKKYHRTFTAPSASLLIVDDNEMNLEVEKKLIKDTLIVVDTATSGADALILTQDKRYDVIFMDHLMPGMDGLECFERIRSQEDGKCRDVPVIIFTANAGSENVEMYRKAGFDGYLMKPVSGSKLEEALLKYILPDKIIMEDGKDEVDTAVNEIAEKVDTAEKIPWYKQLKGIDEVMGIENCGDEEGLKSALEIFYESIPEKSRELRDYYESGDIENYTIKVHALKSSARIVGALSLSLQAQDLESAGNAGNIGYIKEHHDEMISLYEEYGERLKELFEGETESVTEADAGLISVMYEEILEAAEEMNIDRFEEAFKEMQGYKIPDSEADKYNKIKKCSVNFDYEGIIALLKE